MEKPPAGTIIYVTEWELRAMFNEARFVERAEVGELRMRITRSKPCKNESIHNWIPGTLNQMIEYYDLDDRLVAKAHCFMRPDGILAASGKIDPKRVLKDGVYYLAQLPSEADDIL